MARIESKEELRRVIRQAETLAVLLRRPGHTMRGLGERARCAELLESLADIARRAGCPSHHLPDATRKAG